MPVPVSQAWTVATYVLKQKLAGRKRYPFVLMLEPLFRCNLACAGCGKIQYPAHILKQELTPEECFKAVDEWRGRRRGRYQDERLHPVSQGPQAPPRGDVDQRGSAQRHLDHRDHWAIDLDRAE